MIERGAPGYPARLEALRDPPDRLHVDGALPDPSRPAVALVGSRRASVSGRDVATRLARGLAEQGVVVVSGGALGIDAAAHEGALLAGGATLVVLPTSLEEPYPRSHRGLFRRIVAEGGACLAEHAQGAPVGRWRFVARNRIVAALADVVVVVEARAQSGTAATALVARRLGRPVGAVPWRLADEGGAGCLEELRRGAHVVAHPADVVALLPPALRVAAAPPRVEVHPILGWLTARGPSTPEHLAAALGRPLPEVLRELTFLELGGQVVPDAGGRFRGLA